MYNPTSARKVLAVFLCAVLIMGAFPAIAYEAEELLLTLEEETLLLEVDEPAMISPMNSNVVWELDITPELADALNAGDAGAFDVARIGTEQLFSYADGTLVVAERTAASYWMGFAVLLDQLNLVDGERYRATVTGESTDYFFLSHRKGADPWHWNGTSGSNTSAIMEFTTEIPAGYTPHHRGHNIDINVSDRAAFSITSIVIERIVPPLPSNVVWELNITPALADALNAPGGGGGDVARIGTQPLFSYESGTLVVAERAPADAWMGFAVLLDQLNLVDGELYRATVIGESTNTFLLSHRKGADPWHWNWAPGSNTSATMEFTTEIPAGYPLHPLGHIIDINVSGHAAFSISSIVIERVPPLTLPFELMADRDIHYSPETFWFPPREILTKAQTMVVEYPPHTVIDDFAFVRFHGETHEWLEFDSDHPRISREPGRLIFDMRGTTILPILRFRIEGVDNIRDVITRVYLDYAPPVLVWELDVTPGLVDLLNARNFDGLHWYGVAPLGQHPQFAYDNGALVVSGRAEAWQGFFVRLGQVEHRYSVLNLTADGVYRVTVEGSTSNGESLRVDFLADGYLGTAWNFDGANGTSTGVSHIFDTTIPDGIVLPYYDGFAVRIYTPGVSDYTITSARIERLNHPRPPCGFAPLTFDALLNGEVPGITQATRNLLAELVASHGRPSMGHGLFNWGGEWEASGAQAAVGHDIGFGINWWGHGRAIYWTPPPPQFLYEPRYPFGYFVTYFDKNFVPPPPTCLWHGLPMPCEACEPVIFRLGDDPHFRLLNLGETGDILPSVLRSTYENLSLTVVPHAWVGGHPHNIHALKVENRSAAWHGIEILFDAAGMKPWNTYTINITGRGYPQGAPGTITLQGIPGNSTGSFVPITPPPGSGHCGCGDPCPCDGYPNCHCANPYWFSVHRNIYPGFQHDEHTLDRLRIVTNPAGASSSFFLDDIEIIRTYEGEGPEPCHCIGECILGDIDGNGRITSADATLLARSLVSDNIVICRRAADFFGTGHITPENVVLLARALVGHRVTLDQRGG